MKTNGIAIIALCIFLAGCNADPIKQVPDTFSNIGKFVETNLRQEVIEPGYILLIRKNNEIIRLHDNSWLNDLGLKLSVDMEPCTGSCDIAQSDTRAQSYTAAINSELFVASGVHATATTITLVSKTAKRISDGTDAEAAFSSYKAKKPEAYANLIKDINDTVSGLKDNNGTVVIVSAIEIAPLGNIEITFNNGISGETKESLTKQLRLSGDFQFNNDKLIINANGHRPFLLGWRLAEINH